MLKNLINLHKKCLPIKNILNSSNEFRFQWTNNLCTTKYPLAAKLPTTLYNNKLNNFEDERQNNEKIDHVAYVDSDMERKRKILYLEISVLLQEGRLVPNPDLMNEDQWQRLLALTSRSARLKFYTYLFKSEKSKENLQIRKAEKRTETAARLEKLREDNKNNNHIIYGLTHTTYHLRIYDATINLWNNNKLCRAMQFGQKLILDCSYDKHMTEREAINAAKQLMFCFSENRTHDDPFDLYFCNADLNGTTMKFLQRHIPTMLESSFPMNVHRESYLELFPKEQFVYLTPHCRTELTEFNHDDVYIIGAMVDKMNNEPLSLAKAKKLGLRMARLPLEKHLMWGCGNKSLTLNQVINILLDQKQFGNWRKTLEKNVPKRKIVDTNDLRQQINDNHKWNQRADGYKFDYRKNAVTRSVTAQNNTDFMENSLNYKKNILD